MGCQPAKSRSKTHFKNTCAGITDTKRINPKSPTAKRQAIADMKDDPTIGNAWLTNHEKEIRQMHEIPAIIILTDKRLT